MVSQCVDVQHCAARRLALPTLPRMSAGVIDSSQ
jgi:hypothetical protein